jgi:Ig-like domain from next to BRCA1 gene
MEVRIPQAPEARNQFESAWVKGAFAASDYREEIVAFDPPSVIYPGEHVDIRFKVKNLGSATWPAVGTKDFRYQINLGDRWIRTGVTTEDNRAVMQADLPPGGETEIKMTVRAPQMPGDYTLEIDMVHEGVTWFKEKGARPLLLPVRVQP